MSRAKSSKKERQPVDTELTGKVVRRKFAEGSKSEHEAICLETDKGVFVLRRVGGNAFYDEELHALVGKKITSRGRIKDAYFMMKGYIVSNDEW